MLFEIENPYIDLMLKNEEDTLAMIESMLVYAFESGIFSYKELATIIHAQVTTIEQLERHIYEYVDQKKIQAWQRFKQKYSLAFFRDLYRRYNIHPVTILNPHSYPKPLLQTYQPNLVLFCQGNLPIFQKSSISVVGSRNMSTYGKIAIEQLIPELSETRVIVSGLAKGVDVYSHQVAMKNGETIAVIGTGLLTVYPSEHHNIQQYIGRHHLLVSPLPNHAKIQRWHFPYRNLVIAGLSQATIVVEAAEKSGSLITANYALQENRQVFAVPGAINHSLSSGCNQLIYDGATPALQASEILHDLSNSI
ncbi:DNA-processing protein DprA [Aerococcus sp. HMSC10H05]|uniref:DNA-processing protein DprA n=1 Tax=Aerococcus sp. HMSC10H05 TaxID=1581084 RepID=UPI0008A5E7A4|nr:DNA-processing protein DprA [Aerococcus sp. HMSC10H05]OFU52042.1 DNA protecting protein DprA [Aerococcus sp. HMSC10H05]